MIGARKMSPFTRKLGLFSFLLIYTNRSNCMKPGLVDLSRDSALPTGSHDSAEGSIVTADQQVKFNGLSKEKADDNFKLGSKAGSSPVAKVNVLGKENSEVGIHDSKAKPYMNPEIHDTEYGNGRPQWLNENAHGYHQSWLDTTGRHQHEGLAAQPLPISHSGSALSLPPDSSYHATAYPASGMGQSMLIPVWEKVVLPMTTYVEGYTVRYEPAVVGSQGSPPDVWLSENGLHVPNAALPGQAPATGNFWPGGPAYQTWDAQNISKAPHTGKTPYVRKAQPAKKVQWKPIQKGNSVRDATGPSHEKDSGETSNAAGPSITSHQGAFPSSRAEVGLNDGLEKSKSGEADSLSENGLTGRIDQNTVGKQDKANGQIPRVASAQQNLDRGTNSKSAEIKSDQATDESSSSEIAGSLVGKKVAGDKPDRSDENPKPRSYAAIVAEGNKKARGNEPDSHQAAHTGRKILDLQERKYNKVDDKPSRYQLNISNKRLGKDPITETGFPLSQVNRVRIKSEQKNSNVEENVQAEGVSRASNKPDNKKNVEISLRTASAEKKEKVKYDEVSSAATGAKVQFINSPELTNGDKNRGNPVEKLSLSGENKKSESQKALNLKTDNNAKPSPAKEVVEDLGKPSGKRIEIAEQVASESKSSTNKPTESKSISKESLVSQEQEKADSPVQNFIERTKEKNEILENDGESNGATKNTYNSKKNKNKKSRKKIQKITNLFSQDSSNPVSLKSQELSQFKEELTSHSEYSNKSPESQSSGLSDELHVNVQHKAILDINSDFKHEFDEHSSDKEKSVQSLNPSSEMVLENHLNEEKTENKNRVSEEKGKSTTVLDSEEELIKQKVTQKEKQRKKKSAKNPTQKNQTQNSKGEKKSNNHVRKSSPPPDEFLGVFNESPNKFSQTTTRSLQSENVLKSQGRKILSLDQQMQARRDFDETKMGNKRNKKAGDSTLVFLDPDFEVLKNVDSPCVVGVPTVIVKNVEEVINAELIAKKGNNKSLRRKLRKEIQAQSKAKRYPNAERLFQQSPESFHVISNMIFGAKAFLIKGLQDAFEQSIGEDKGFEFYNQLSESEDLGGTMKSTLDSHGGLSHDSLKKKWGKEVLQDWKDNELSFEIMDTLARQLYLNFAEDKIVVEPMERSAYFTLRKHWIENTGNFLNSVQWLSNIMDFQESEIRIWNMIHNAQQRWKLENMNEVKLEESLGSKSKN